MAAVSSSCGPPRPRQQQVGQAPAPAPAPPHPPHLEVLAVVVVVVIKVGHHPVEHRGVKGHRHQRLPPLCGAGSERAGWWGAAAAGGPAGNALQAQQGTRPCLSAPSSLGGAAGATPTGATVAPVAAVVLAAAGGVAGASGTRFIFRSFGSRQVLWPGVRGRGAGRQGLRQSGPQGLGRAAAAAAAAASGQQSSPGRLGPHQS